MFSKITTILAAVALIASVAVAGGYKAPKKVMGDEPIPPLGDGVPGTVSAVGPGDSIGFSFYDYGTNGGACRNLINFGDGQLSFARMAAVDSATDTRGSYFKFYDGSSWSANWNQVETTRRGWTNIDQIEDAGGVEVVSGHVWEMNVDAARGADVWSSTVLACVENAWPRLAIGSGFTIHAIGTAGPLVIGYHQSLDAGATWTCDITHVTAPGVAADADAYDITADGMNVAYVVAGAFGDVGVYESADGGATFTETVIYDIDETGGTEGEKQPDGSCSILYDSNGNLHVVFGTYQVVAGVAGESVNSGIHHWSAATGVQEVVLPNDDPSIVSVGARDGNLNTEPDLTADANGNIAFIYTDYVTETDGAGLNYSHIFAVGSRDGGATWGAPLDITPGSGFDGAYGSVADLADDYVHFVYMCDAQAGNWLQGTHGQVANAYMYHMVPLADILDNTSGVKEIDGVLPEAFQLEQNYPNPFNPTTNIRYSIPTSAFVTLTVYDMVGQEVATLFSGHQDAGNYVADFNATNLANGTYFYTLKADNFTETRKMLLVK
jgi:hypothetical protein